MKAWLTCLLLLGIPAAGDDAPARIAATTNHWAFQPVRRDIHPPDVATPSWCATDVDRFILARLEAAGSRPAPAADPRTLIRRLALDLTGLPPDAADVDAFERDSKAGGGSGASEKAYADLLDRMLASPRYGERQARPWLDIARYSDTKGYVYGREERTFVHAPAYRDWVIRAFNTDLPYDRFLKLQIAADQFVPQGSPDLAAMGFITLGRRFLSVTHDIIDDRIDVVTRGTMAITVQCARCHDHKFDPVPTTDYYSLYGVFRATAERLSTLGPEPTDPEYLKRRTKLLGKMRERREEVAARARTRAGDYLAAQLELAKYPEEGFDEILGADDLNPALVRRWRDWLHTAGRPGTVHPIFGPWHALAALAQDEFSARAGTVLATVRADPGLNARISAAFAEAPADLREAARRYAGQFKEAIAPPPGPDSPARVDPATTALRAFLLDPDGPCAVPDTGIVDNDQFFVNDLREELWKLQSELDRWLIAHPESPHAVTLTDRPAGPNPRVFKRGNPGMPGEEVPRHFLGAVSGTNSILFFDGSGRRELAGAIVRPDNPLTARVAVNRIWAQHFGTGLVGTPSDFGLRADPPADPALLDWLAARFMDGGWSVKALHRLICGSATYRQQTGGPATAPDGALLAHTRVPLRRLDFEQLRDSLLAVTGELDPSPTGTPADNFAPTNRRRTIYGTVDRQFLPATMRLFDFPIPDTHVAARHETTVPQQALFLLNHGWLAARAKSLASRSSPAESTRRIQALYRLAYQRHPTAREIDAGLRFVATADAQREVPVAPVKETDVLGPWEQYAQVLLLANEFTYVD